VPIEELKSTYRQLFGREMESQIYPSSER
jgi:hypothetical protein